MSSNYSYRIAAVLPQDYLAASRPSYEREPSTASDTRGSRLLVKCQRCVGNGQF